MHTIAEFLGIAKPLPPAPPRTEISDEDLRNIAAAELQQSPEKVQAPLPMANHTARTVRSLSDWSMN